MLPLALVLVLVFDAIILPYKGLGALSAAIYTFEGAMLVVAIYASMFGGIKFWLQWLSISLVACVMLIRPVETQNYFTIFFFTYFLKEVFRTVNAKDYDKIQNISWIAALITLGQGLRVRFQPELHILEANPLDDVFGLWLIFFGVLSLKWVLKTTNQVSEIDQKLALKGKELSFTKSALALTSHHLKNPLATAKLALSAAKFGKRSNGRIELSEEVYERIDSAVNRCALMVDEMVNNQNSISRIQKEQIPLSEVIESIEEELDGQISVNRSYSGVILNATEAFVLRLAITTHLNNSIEHGGDEVILFTTKEEVLIKDNGNGLPTHFTSTYGKKVLGSRSNRGMGAYQTAKLLESIGWKQELIHGNGFGIKISKKLEEVPSEVPLESPKAVV